MVICLERGAHLHMAQLKPLPLTVSCFSKIQIGFTFLVLAHPGSPRQRAGCVCVFSIIFGALSFPMGHGGIMFGTLSSISACKARDDGICACVHPRPDAGVL